MAGNTTTIDVQAFKADYAAAVTHYELAERHTITRDQIIRLVRVWGLPLRHDRKAARSREATGRPARTKSTTSGALRFSGSGRRKSARPAAW